VAFHKIGTMSERERVRTDQVGPDWVNSVQQLSVPKLIALHLLPGALVTATFVAQIATNQGADIRPVARTSRVRPWIALAAAAIVLALGLLGVLPSCSFYR